VALAAQAVSHQVYTQVDELETVTRQLAVAAAELQLL
jgi:hypothetical protein